MKTVKIYFLLFSVFITPTLFAQKNLVVVGDKIEKYNEIFPTEKLYLSFDKPYYNSGDTLWFKAYLLNADHSVNTRSDRLYVELFNDSSRLVERRVIPLLNGLGNGDFSLEPSLKDGSYSIRAYTNWQQNFGSDYFFQKNFYIGNAGDKTWLVASDQKLINEGAKKSLDIKVKITNLQNEPAGFKDLEIYLVNNQKKIMRTELQTTQDGLFDTKIPLPDDKLTGTYSFLIIDKKNKSQTVSVPLLLNDLDEIDLQFMPEGGYLINGINNKVAFKALGADGLSKNVTGEIVNKSKEVVAKFTSTHNGMGNFYLLPKKEELYTAVFKQGMKEKQVKLSIAKDEGTSLRIDHLSLSDSLYIFIKASTTKRLDEPYEIIAQAADSLLFVIKINLKNGFSNLKLAKNIFPDGIIHFTLFSPAQEPINERNVFLNFSKKINLNIETAKNEYKPKDSIALEITATNEDRKPLQGSFTIAVTDDQQVKMPKQCDNIISYYLLQNNLRGNIEDPNWYFIDKSPNTLSALDNLLLTQGWIGYNWKEILKFQNAPKFMAERNNKIIGKLTGLFKAPIANAKVSLLSLGKEIFFTDTVSDKNGEFLFKDLPIVDSAAYTIKIKNAKDKTSNALITVNEFEPPLPINFTQKVMPWYVNSDSTLLKHFKNGKDRVKQAERATMALTGIALKEVEIKAANPNITYEVAWDAKIYKYITEEELKKMPRKSLMDLLYEKFVGLRISNEWYPSCYAKLGHYSFDEFVIGANIISSIRVDKISTTRVAFGAGPKEWFDTNKRIFETLNAEDIKSIQLYKGCVYYYLEITTRSGSGPWVGPAKGVYVYKPLPLNSAREFYSPKYNVENSTALPDLRSTIYWNANIVTNEQGKAKVSFYAADKPSNYTIKLEGSDLLGRFGYQKSNIKISITNSSK